MALCYRSNQLFLYHCCCLSFQESTSTSQFSTAAIYDSSSEPIFSIYSNHIPTVPFANLSCFKQPQLQFLKSAQIPFTILLHPHFINMLVSLVPPRPEWPLSFRQELYYINDDRNLHPCLSHCFALYLNQRDLYRLWISDVPTYIRFIHPHLE